jgi:DNA repair protein RecO (recombination protein O)
VFLRKSSEALDLLTEAKLERRFRSSGRDISGLYGAYYVAELLNELTHDGDPHPELFDLAVETLEHLSAGSPPAGTTTLRFELVALRILGHLPSLSHCVECGEPVAGARQGAARRTAFGLTVGGVLCDSCRPGKKNVVSLSSESLALASLFAAEGDGWKSAAIERRQAGELRGLFSQYISHLVGHKTRLHDYLVPPGTPPASI